MPLITNGEQTFEASDKAFSLIYAERGFTVVEKPAPKKAEKPAPKKG